MRSRAAAGILALAAGALGCAAPRAAMAKVVLRCADGDAEVTVDGAPAGRASDYAGKPGRLRLPAGVHRIVLRGTSGAVAVREVSVGPGDDLALTVALPAPAGSPGSAGSSRGGLQ